LNFAETNLGASDIYFMVQLRVPTCNWSRQAESSQKVTRYVLSM